ncbi:hypothetical protein [Sinorhizobium saheli]|uniref:Uncharacterized protein n=1 Tax=Sinorhizobium saheli TaxID=36856 RepID=A0A178YRK8_SINSA|nr:hypothetical protein [Sinorhizobium saheli]MQW86628.1 hypothetical protein [Sinorhizobium saheli]OAP50027.1 hypothetical protein ATB98_09580 [Sinorhizobium saheli]
MRDMLVEMPELKARFLDGKFWLRAFAAMALGYVYAAFGFAAMQIVCSPLTVFARLPLEEPLREVAAAFVSLIYLFAASFVMMLIVMAKPVLVALPIIATFVFTLQTGCRRSMALWACAGILIGWPIAVLVSQWEAFHWTSAAGSIGAGAMFGLALWQECFKPRLRLRAPPAATAAFGRDG